MKTLITILISTFLFSMACFGQTEYYVDNANGNDEWAGTSLSTAWKTIQNACENATPGSTVYILGGIYYEQLYMEVSGTEGNDIVFRNYDDNEVIIDGTNSSGTVMLEISDKSYLEFQSITIRNLVKNDAQGILVNCSENGAVTDIYFENIKITNISWSDDPDAIPGENDNSQPFIAYGEGVSDNNVLRNISIQNCEIFNNITGFSEALALDGNIDGFIISGNHIYNNTNIGIDIAGHYQVSSNTSLDQARYGVITDNQCYNNVSNYATSAGIYVDGGNNVYIERNYCYGNGWGIEVGCEPDGTTEYVFVRDNLIVKNREAGIAFGGYDQETTGRIINCYFTNNTLFQNNTLNDGTGEMYITKASGCTIENNIFYTNAQNVLFTMEKISPQSGNTFDYNCWYTPSNDTADITVSWKGKEYNSFSSYQTGSGQENNSIFENPEFMDVNPEGLDLHLSEGSPCIDRGNPEFKCGDAESDYEVNPRILGQYVDIGAYESSYTAVKETEQNHILKIYPNPAGEFINLKSDSQVPLTYQLLNLVGEEISSGAVNGDIMTIDISHLPTGIYVLRVGGSCFKILKI